MMLESAGEMKAQDAPLQMNGIKTMCCCTLLAHTCNLSYSGGRDQEDCSWKPSQENSSQDPILKKIHYTKGLVEWLKW
jgi:hypothetical protein